MPVTDSFDESERELDSNLAIRPHPSRIATGVRFIVRLVPGLALASIMVGISYLVSTVAPGVSVLIVAIVLGVVARNVVKIPDAMSPGLNFAAKTLLRWGIVLLGLQLAIGNILDLGIGSIIVIVAAVGSGFVTAIYMGRWIGVGLGQRILIACGFSICGAAAVAAAEGVLESEDEEDVVTAIALVVLFGTLMIPIVPGFAAILDLSEVQAGVLIGASVHEVAQVVAASGTIGAITLQIAVVVKLGRVILLAPIIAGLSLYKRRTLSGSSTTRSKPPLIPLFVLGFIAMVFIASVEIVPDVILDFASAAQVTLLSLAMFALGTGVKIRKLLRVGHRPLLLALVTTLVILSVSLLGALLLV